MTLYCDNCGKAIHALCSFCPFCGTEAPKKTIAANVKKQKIKNGIYCPVCKEINLDDALFCLACGGEIYKRPVEKALCCPKCGEKNSLRAKHCCNCGLLLDDWFEMRGEIGERLGVAGNIALIETMNEITYEFVTQERVTLGRDRRNDIVIPSDWVSARHCAIDLKQRKLTDLGATNGTFINRSPDRIKSIPLAQIQELNLAGTFTFSICQPPGLFVIRLTAILAEPKEVNMRLEDSNRLRQRYFIFVLDDGEFMVRRMDGKIVLEKEPGQDYYFFKASAGRYYFSDYTHQTDSRLILKNEQALAVNWKVVHPDSRGRRN